MREYVTKTPADLERAWHVDSWDTRGGICFACFGSSTDHALESSELQSVVIAPPDFKPVQLGDRSLSLAAIRSGRFQDGLFLNGVSVPFAALSDLVEFVRRSHSGSASNDPDGQDGPPPRPDGPIPASEGPSSPEGLMRSDPQSASSALAGSYREFNMTSAALQLGDRAPEFAWNLTYLREGSTAATDNCLLRALWLTFDELLNRAMNLADDHLLNWWRAAYGLPPEWTALSRLGH